jgi:serine/threonine-protein kinase HipA
LAFSVAVNNTDDHLRNHGFLWRGGGWRLSPAFDVNPNPDPASERTTSIGFVHTRAEAAVALLSAAPEFDLAGDEARRCLAEVTDAVADWRSVASANGVPEHECARFTDCFATPLAFR